MKEAIKEIVDKHFDNLIIDLANDPRITWKGGDMFPVDQLALDFKKENLTKWMTDMVEMPGRRQQTN